MSLRLSHTIALPPAAKPGGFGSADLHHASGRLFVARPANDSVDVIDTIFGVCLYSVPDLRGVTAVVAGQKLNEVFAADANENKISFFQVVDRGAEKMVVGRRPSALAWDARRGTLWVANLGHPAHTTDSSLSVVDFVTQTRVIASAAMPGRPCVLHYDDGEDMLYASVDDPARLQLFSGAAPSEAAAVWALPAANVRALVVDRMKARLLSLCADGSLLALAQESGRLEASTRLPGGPGEMAFHPELRLIYVAQGEPGAVAVVDADTLQPVESVPTEADARTLCLDAPSNLLYVFCPLSCRVLVFRLS